MKMYVALYVGFAEWQLIYLALYVYVCVCVCVYVCVCEFM